MKKRVLLVIAAMSLLVAVGLTGCGGTNVADPNAASATSTAPVTSMAMSDVKEDNLNGMLTYLKGNGIIKEATKEMKAEMIGAVAGTMVETIYGDKTAFVEIYEFDLNNLNDKAKDVIANVKDNSKFISMDGEANAAMSNNGKFIMIYKDQFTDDTNKAIQERGLSLFRDFNPTVNASSNSSSTVSINESQTNSEAATSATESSVSSATAESVPQ